MAAENGPVEVLIRHLKRCGELSMASDGLHAFSPYCQGSTRRLSWLAPMPGASAA